jgi:exopolysaccharide production protein ExoZ
LETNRRLDHIESIRAIAAIAVAIFHFTNFYSGKSFILTNEKVRSFFEYGAQGVEIFYVVSGFIITYSLYHSRYQITHYFKYLAKRFVRLLPPYYVTIGLILLVSFILNRFVWGIPFDLQV